MGERGIQLKAVEKPRKRENEWKTEKGAKKVSRLSSNPSGTHDI